MIRMENEGSIDSLNKLNIFLKKWSWIDRIASHGAKVSLVPCQVWTVVLDNTTWMSIMSLNWEFSIKNVTLAFEFLNHISLLHHLQTQRALGFLFGAES